MILNSIEYIKILAVGLAVVFGLYFFGMPVDFSLLPEAKADISTTSLTVGNEAPSVTNVSLNTGADINLSENTTVAITATSTITDNNGFLDFATTIGKAFLNASTTGCSADDNSCYIDSGCATSSCSGNDCVLTCTFNIQFHAIPTATGSPDAADTWVAFFEVSDQSASSGSATNSTQEVDMNILTALDVEATIPYGVLAPGAQSPDPLNTTSTATTTGNEAIDINVSGTDMCTDFPTCSAATTSITNQRYTTSTDNTFAPATLF